MHVAQRVVCDCRSCRVNVEQASVLQLVARQRRREEAEDRQTAEILAWPSRHALADRPYWDNLDIDLFAQQLVHSL